MGQELKEFFSITLIWSSVLTTPVEQTLISNSWGRGNFTL